MFLFHFLYLITLKRVIFFLAATKEQITTDYYKDIVIIDLLIENYYFNAKKHIIIGVVCYDGCLILYYIVDFNDERINRLSIVKYLNFLLLCCVFIIDTP